MEGYFRYWGKAERDGVRIVYKEKDNELSCP